MEQQILCENKSFKLFILSKNLINVWGGKGGPFTPQTGKRLTAWGKRHHGIDTNISAKIMFFLNNV